MNRRIIRNILSGTLLGAYSLLAAGTSGGPSELNPQLLYEEYPLQLYVHGAEAYVIDYYVDGPEQRMRFSRVTIDGTTNLLHEGPLPTPRGRWQIASVVTDATGGTLAFAMANTTTEGSVALALTHSGAALTKFIDRDGRYFSTDDVSQLAIVDRGPSRQWVFTDRASLTMDDSFLPLFEISSNDIHWVANNVLWAGCQEALCRQVRMEHSRLRLYANTETDAEYFSVITEVAYTPGMGHYACSDPAGNPAVAFGDTVFSISMTAPALTATDRLHATGACSVPPPIDAVTGEHAVDSNTGFLTGTFAAGDRISIAIYAENSTGTDTIDMRLWVNIDHGNQARQSFRLHAR